MATSFPSIDKIKYNDIEFHEKIGQGGFGSVSRVTFKQPYKGYTEAAAKSLFELGEKEVEVMSQLEHPNIVKLIGFSQARPTYFIIMEYASQGSLRDYLSDHSKPLSYELKKKWVTESASAIEYLHSMNFLHRDIKPQNCLLFQDNLLKLCDFGLAREIHQSQTTSSAKGTCRYMAPEIHRGNEQGRAIYSKPADIYAYGMLVLEICTRKPPFDGMEWQKVVLEVGNGTKPTIPEDCPQDLSHLIQQCWNTDPKRRTTIGSIIKGFGSTVRDNHLKLCDFGLACEIDHSQTTSTAKGTYRYMAPEIHRGNEQTVVLEVGNGTKPTIPEDCPRDLSHLIQQCWNTDPKRRTTIGSTVRGLGLGSTVRELSPGRWEIHPKHQGKPLQVNRIACSPNGDIVMSGAWRQLYIIGSDWQHTMPLNSPENTHDKQLQWVQVYGITVTLQGYIMVVDRTKYVKVFNASGKYLHCFNVLTASDDPNTICRLVCIATDRAGQILVHDYIRDVITIHTCPEGRLVKKVKYKNSQAATQNMVVNSKSQILLYLSDFGHLKVVAIDYSGNEVFTFTPKINENVRGMSAWVSGIACDGNDNIYTIAKVASNSFQIPFTGHIHQYSPTGAYLQCIAKGLKSPSDLSITPNGSLVVANGESILIYSLK